MSGGVREIKRTQNGAGLTATQRTLQQQMMFCLHAGRFALLQRPSALRSLRIPASAVSISAGADQA